LIRENDCDASSITEERVDGHMETLVNELEAAESNLNESAIGEIVMTATATTTESDHTEFDLSGLANGPEPVRSCSIVVPHDDGLPLSPPSSTQHSPSIDLETAEIFGIFFISNHYLFGYN